MHEDGHWAMLQERGQGCCPEAMVTAQRRGEGTSPRWGRGQEPDALGWGRHGV